MSKIFENDNGIYISHKKYIDHLYENINGSKFLLNPQLFDVKTPYKPNKRKKICNKVLNQDETSVKFGKVKDKFHSFMESLFKEDILKNNELTKDIEDNLSALKTADYIYEETEKCLVNDAFGSNLGPAKREKVNNSYFLFPENSTFFSKDTEYIDAYLKDQKFDLILLDPPWWNKYIRRKRKKSGDAYNMMFNDDLKRIPIERLVSDNGLVAIWCTNSEQHLEDLLNNILPKWQVNYLSTWYWVKITTKGVPICKFSEPPRKQPFEKIIFAAKNRDIPVPENGKLLVSIPSAIHSHKPPLAEVLKEFLPRNPKCLELFARYLVAGWTSYGNEVLRLQHECMFMKTLAN